MQKNKFLTFMFSIIPGCGHMYLGYMKRGLQFMSMFAVSMYFTIIFAAAYMNFDFIGAIFGVCLPVIWFYQIFDSMHIVSLMRKFEIEFPQDDGFFIPGFLETTNVNSVNFFKKPGVTKGIAISLICVGVYVLFLNVSNGIYRLISYEYNEIYSRVYSTIRSYVPSIAISLLLIFAGIKLMKGNNVNKNDKNGGE